MKKEFSFGIMIIIIVLLILIGNNIITSEAIFKPECNDRQDNDFDGKIDMNDIGCTSRKDNDESNCGDTKCEGKESCSTCTKDCGVCPPVCGDGTCNGNETCSTCQIDCGNCQNLSCGDGTCNGNETCSTCQIDCGNCQNLSCTDTDGGINLLIKGYVSGYNQFGLYVNSTDSCIYYSNLTALGVSEYYCENDLIKGSDSYCPSGYICLDGACCISGQPGCITETKCTDSDGGINLLVKGYTLQKSDIGYIRYDDSCEGTSHVWEKYCNSQDVSSNIYSLCPTGTTCQDGACI